jgi:hypothetical protein
MSWVSLVCADASLKIEGAWHDTCGEPECQCFCHDDTPKEKPDE